MFESILVTVRAVLEYLQKARAAQEKIKEANEQMNKAAQDLCNVWKGEGAEAFAAEQKVLYGYCKQLADIGDEYCNHVQKDAEIYEQADSRARAAIEGK